MCKSMYRSTPSPNSNLPSETTSFAFLKYYQCFFCDLIIKQPSSAILSNSVVTIKIVVLCTTLLEVYTVWQSLVWHLEMYKPVKQIEAHHNCVSLLFI